MASNRGPLAITTGSSTAVRPWQLTEPDRAVQYAQQRQLQEDIRQLKGWDSDQLSGMDVSRPFTSLEDAVERLFPFHILSAQDGGEADLDETPDHAGAGLVSSRSDAWQEISVRRAADAAAKVQAFVGRMEAHEAKDAANAAKVKAEERYLWERLMHQTAKDALAAERALQPLPAPPLQLSGLQLQAGAQSNAMAQILALQQQQLAKLQQQQQQAAQQPGQQQQGMPMQHQQAMQPQQLQAALVQQQQQLQAMQSLAARQQQQPQQQQQQQQLAALLAQHMQQPQQQQQQGGTVSPQQLQQLQMLLQAQQARQAHGQQMQPQQMQSQQMQMQPQQLQPQQMQPQHMQPQQTPPS